MFVRLEAQGAQGIELLLGEHLIVLVNYGDCQQDPSSRSDSAQEIGDNGQRSDTHTTEGSGDGDVALKKKRKEERGEDYERGRIFHGFYVYVFFGQSKVSYCILEGCMYKIFCLLRIAP